MTDKGQQRVSIQCRVVSEVTWQPLDQCSFTDELALFRYRIDVPVNELLIGQLTPEEQARAARFYRDADRNRFIYARLLRRMLLARYLTVSPDAVSFANGSNGKPELSGAQPWHFNVSHAGEWILLAISRQPVGTDVEQLQPAFDRTDLVAQSFSVAEQQYIRTSSDPITAFYQLWTCKESIVKATGKGIDDDFACIPSRPGTHWAASQLVGSAQNWLSHLFWLAATYPAAVTGSDQYSCPYFYTIDDRVLLTQNQ